MAMAHHRVRRNLPIVHGNHRTLLPTDRTQPRAHDVHVVDGFTTTSLYADLLYIYRLGTTLIIF